VEKKSVQPFAHSVSPCDFAKVSKYKGNNTKDFYYYASEYLMPVVISLALMMLTPQDE